MDEKLYHIFDVVCHCFFIDFGKFLDGFWNSCWHSKSIKFGGKIRSLTKYQKQGFRVDYLSKITFSGGQHQAKIDKKSIKNSFKIGAQFMVHLGG